MIPHKNEFFLYGRKNCHLCDQMKLELDELLQPYQGTCHYIDVDTDPELQHRYGARVPVLVSGNRELSEIRLNREVVLDFLSN